MSSVLRPTEGPPTDRVLPRTTMSRQSKPGTVAARVAVASKAQSVVSLPESAHLALESAARLMEVARDHEETAAPQTHGSFDGPFDATDPSRSPHFSDQSLAQPPRHSGAARRTSDQRQHNQRRLERRIRAHLVRGELTVTLTDNRYTMISVRRENKDGKRYKVRLHHMFADATPTITRALARYVAHNDRDASRLLGDFIDANQHLVSSRERKAIAPRLTTSGLVYDLRVIFEDLNQHYFANSIEARITWGQKSGKKKRRNSIKMGSYSVEDRLIRIHRSLDREFVPRFFVEWVVYHEMLHQVHDIRVVNGRRQFHSREFLRDEAKFERYAEARAWERAHLDELLTY